MFHSSGYFKKTLCPFHEHGLCHRPHCHYSHKAPMSSAAAKRKPPPVLKSRSSSGNDNTKSVLNLDLSKIDDKIMSDVAIAMNQVSNYFGSSSDGPSTSQQKSRPEETYVPSYAPEKCMGVSNVSYSLSHPTPSPPPELRADASTSTIKIKSNIEQSTAKPSPSDQSLVTEVPTDRPPDKDGSPESAPLTLEDVFGGPLDDDDDVAGGDLGVVMETEDQPGSMVTTETDILDILPDFSQMKAEFNKVTAMPQASKSADPPSLKRKPEDDPYGSMLRKKWKSYSGESQGVREPARVAPKPVTVKSNFSDMLLGSDLYMGKSRKAATAKAPKTSVASRPKLPLTVNAKIPTSLRQKYLDAYIDEHLKMTSDPQQAYSTSLDEEKTVFEKSSKRMMYMNHATSTLKKLREQARGYQAEQKARSDERVKQSAQPKTEGVKVVKKLKSDKGVKKPKAEASKIVSTKDWRSLESELHDTFFTDEMKTFSRQFDKAGSKQRKVLSDNPSASTIKFYSKSSKVNKHVKPHPLPSSTLETDLFGESSSDDDQQATPPATPTSDEQDPNVSFESALTSMEDRKKKKKTKVKRLKHHGKSKSECKLELHKASRTVKKLKAVAVSKHSVKELHLPSPVTDKPSTTGMDIEHLQVTDCVPDVQTAMDVEHQCVSVDIHTTAPRIELKEPIIDLVRVRSVSSTSRPSVDLTETTPTSEEDAVFGESLPKDLTDKSLSQPLQPPTSMFSPSGPLFNLSKIPKKPAPDVASIAKTLGKRPVRKAAKVSEKSSVTVLKKKDIPFTPAVFYRYMLKYLMTEDQLVDNGYPRPADKVGMALINRGDAPPPSIERVGENAHRHMCCRCGKPFVIYNDGQYQSLDECFYHYGRLVKSREYGEGVVSMYTCCQGRRGSDGCQWAKLHVTSGELPSRESGYVTTATVSLNNQCVYALDCEMCYTTAGLQLTRVSVINEELRVVFESLVKPNHPIVDYNTRFSGLKAEDFVAVTTTLGDVQQQLLTLIGSDTVLVGHSLESDLKAMKIIHDRVVDTAIVFPHKKGPPYKRALKALMTEYLHKFIQNNDGGHDSLEDSQACMELMIWKVKGDLKRDSRRTSSS